MFGSVVVVLAILGVLFYFWGAVILATAASVMVAVSVFLGGMFLFGTASFWLLVLVVTLAASWFVSEGPNFDEEEELWSVTALVTAVLFGCIVAFTNRNLFSFDGYSGWLVAGGVLLAFAGYLVLGAGWSWFRYKKFLNKRLAGLESWRSHWYQTNSYGMKTEQDVVAVVRAGEPKGYMHSSNPSSEQEKKYYKYNEAAMFKGHVEAALEGLKPYRNMNRILTWIGLWPWSMVAQVLRDPVKLVYEMMLGVYNSLYNKTAGQLEKNFQSAFSDDSPK